jgi:hypothetical protein
MFSLSIALLVNSILGLRLDFMTLATCSSSVLEMCSSS